MKQLFIAFALLFSTATFAQSDKYMSAMKANIQQMKDAKTSEENIAVIQKFERIAEAEKTQWLPYYYAAMLKATMAIISQEDNKDALADEATTTLDKADALSKNNSEILCIRSLIATAKMLVNPQARYMEFGMLINKYINEAQKADANNPRPYYLEASNIFNTPKQFGGGCEKSKPIAEKALQLYNSFKPENEIAPNWGKENIEQILKACN